jgi:hypothetical protein
MPRPSHRLAAAVLLTGLLAASAIRAEETVYRGARAENTRQVGPFSVWCARNGTLSGLDHEECRIWIEQGANGINAWRTYDHMHVYVHGAWCRKTPPPTPSPAMFLARRDLANAKTAATRLQRAFDAAADACGAPRRTFRQADLRALLRFTSGLTNEDFGAEPTGPS